MNVRRETKKLLAHLMAVNLAALGTATSFFMISGVEAALGGFLSGLIVSAYLVKKKTESKKSAGVFEELSNKRTGR